MTTLLLKSLTLLVVPVLLAGCSIDSEAVNNPTVSVVETDSGQSGEKIQDESETGETIGQKNAVEKAESYLSFGAFSRTGLIEQLEFEGFTAEEAEYAVDKINPDWNEQAALKAASYLEFSSFSRQGLIEQLVFEGFSESEAEYGAKAVGY